MKTKLLTCLLLVLAAGCMQWNFQQDKFDASGNIISHTKGSMTQCLADSSRTKVLVEFNGIGKATIGSSVVDAEELKGILVELMPWFKIALGVMP